MNMGMRVGTEWVGGILVFPSTAPLEPSTSTGPHLRKRNTLSYCRCSGCRGDTAAATLKLRNVVWVHGSSSADLVLRKLSRDCVSCKGDKPEFENSVFSNSGCLTPATLQRLGDVHETTSAVVNGAKLVM